MTSWWRRPAAVDAAVAAGVAAVCLAGTAAEVAHAPAPVPPAAGGYLLAAAAAGVLYWRRHRPAAVAAGVLLVVAAYHLLGYPGEAPAAALFVAVYSLAAYGSHRRSLAGAVLLAGLAYVLPTLPRYPVPWSSPAIYGPVLSMLWVALLGASVRQRRLEADDRVRRAAAEVREQLARERLRIARDLHDVLAHTISVIAVQSADALDGLDRTGGDPRPALGVIRSASRQAMAELRATLGLLRADDGAATHPQPRLDELPALAETTRAAGLPVVLDLAGDLDGLPPVVTLTAYRIVQEALTNARRHAGARSVTVAVRRQPDAVLVDVADDGVGPGPEPATGVGLTGMRERAEAIGGTVTTGPDKGGGFRVAARLPLGAPPGYPAG